MAKSKVNKKSKSPKAASKQPKEQDKNERLVTMEALAEGASSDDEMPPEEEWNKEALALRQAIAGGAYDHLVKDADKKKGGNDNDDDSIEEVELGDNDDENDEDSEDDDEDEEEDMADGDDVEEEDESEAGEEMGDLKKLVADGASDSEEEDEEEEEEEDDSPERRNIVSHKALSVVTDDLAAVTNSMPWAEKIFIIPPTPLPFGYEEGAAGTPLDIHDDLKREVAFYDMALEAVVEARVQCKKSGIPFSRPEDFFAEMVKTDGKLLLVLHHVAARVDKRYFLRNWRLTFIDSCNATLLLHYRPHGNGKGSTHL
jgi:rRNA-processing protein EBP2